MNRREALKALVPGGWIPEAIRNQGGVYSTGGRLSVEKDTVLLAALMGGSIVINE